MSPINQALVAALVKAIRRDTDLIMRIEDQITAHKLELQTLGLDQNGNPLDNPSSRASHSSHSFPPKP